MSQASQVHMKTTITRAGEMFLSIPPGKWHDANDPHGQCCLMGGQQMWALSEEEPQLSFHLRYLGFKSPDYATMEEAKAVVQSFAAMVLDRLKQSVLLMEPCVDDQVQT
jgi:hypothetical protein